MVRAESQDGSVRPSDDGSSQPGHDGSVESIASVAEGPVDPGVDAYVLALQISAGRITAAVVDRSGFVRHSRHRRTPPGTEAAVTAAISLARSVADKAPGDVEAVGVAIEADVDVANGIVRHSGQLGWHNVHLAGAIGAEIAVPVVVDQSVRAAAMAEGANGAAAGAANWLYLQIDDEIHAAAIVNASLLRGATSTAGEVGHLPIYPFGVVCRCGQRGCTEAYGSASAVRRRYTEVTRRTASVAQISARFGRDPLADEVWRQACEALGIALAMYTLIQDPQVVVLAGEMTTAGSVLISAVDEGLRERLAWREPPRLVIASAPTPVLHGAALLARATLQP